MSRKMGKCCITQIDNYTQKADRTAADITTLGNDVMLEIPYRVGYSIEWLNAGKNLLKVSVTNEPDNAAFKYDAFSLDSYNDCDRIYIGVYKGHCSGNKAYSSSQEKTSPYHRPLTHSEHGAGQGAQVISSAHMAA